MGDQRPWVKLWKSWLRDPDIQALSLEHRARWVELLLLVADNGEGGCWLLRRGLDDLPAAWRRSLGTRRLTAFLEALPGVQVTFHAPATREERGPRSRRVAPAFDDERAPRSNDDSPLHGNDETPLQQITITFSNWRKYQVDDSTDRVRRHRERASRSRPAPPPRSNAPTPLHVTTQKRREENPPTPHEQPRAQHPPPNRPRCHHGIPLDAPGSHICFND